MPRPVPGHEWNSWFDVRGTQAFGTDFPLCGGYLGSRGTGVLRWGSVNGLLTDPLTDPSDGCQPATDDTELAEPSGFGHR